MWDGWFSLGGNEIGNSSRALGYARTADCKVEWLTAEDECPILWDALDQETYDISNIADAPWYDEDNPEVSSRFLGVNVVSVTGIEDSTHSATTTEKVLRGGRVGQIREASREVRVRVVLTADGRDAMEVGKIWLSSALRVDACGTHGTACGGADFEFFADIPPTSEDGLDDYSVEVDALRRFLHSVKRVSGPLLQQEFKSPGGRHFGYVMEFTLIAEDPGVYSLTREIELPPITPTVVEDIVKNLVMTPSAELGSGSIQVATNLATNPSVEVNATGWSTNTSTVSGSSAAAYVTSGQSGDIAAHGAFSYRTRILGNGSTSAAGVVDVTVAQTVSLSGVNPASRISFNMWVARLIFGADTVSDLASITVAARWLTAGAVFISETIIGTTSDSDEFDGIAFSLASQAIPATAGQVEVVARFDNVEWGSSATPVSNSDIRLYADALAVTIP